MSQNINTAFFLHEYPQGSNDVMNVVERKFTEICDYHGFI